MPESFGARLRQQRERQHIALTAIAEQTKIQVSLLDGLERDDVSHWPAGIFRRAFVRSYAQAIALEPDVVVREFLELHPDPNEVVATVPPIVPGGDDAPASAGPPTRLRYLVGSALSALSGLRPGIVPRRPSAVEDPAAADGAQVRALAASEPDVLAAAQQCTGPGRVDETAAVPLLEESAPDLLAAAQQRTEPGRDDETGEAVPLLQEATPDLLAAAHLCTELGRVDVTGEAAPLLQEAARILDAVGLIVWVWHPQDTELRPALAQGYSETMLAQLPKVERDTDNATAAAFRSAQTCVVNRGDLGSGAVVVPLMTAVGCVGVLAIELQHGSEQKESVRALGTIFAAQLARLVGAARPTQVAEALSDPLAEPCRPEAASRSAGLLGLPMAAAPGSPKRAARRPIAGRL